MSRNVLFYVKLHKSGLIDCKQGVENKQFSTAVKQKKTLTSTFNCEKNLFIKKSNAYLRLIKINRSSADHQVSTQSTLISIVSLLSDHRLRQK